MENIEGDKQTSTSLPGFIVLTVDLAGLGLKELENVRVSLRLLISGTSIRRLISIPDFSFTKNFMHRRKPEKIVIENEHDCLRN